MSLEYFTDKNSLQILSLKVLFESDEENLSKNHTCNEKSKKKYHEFSRTVPTSSTSGYRNEIGKNGECPNSVLKVSFDQINEMEGDLKIKLLTDRTAEGNNQASKTFDKCVNPEIWKCLSFCSDQIENNTIKIENVSDEEINFLATVGRCVSTQTEEFENLRDVYVQTISRTRLFQTATSQTKFPDNFVNDAEIQTDISIVLPYDLNDGTNSLQSHIQQTKLFYDYLIPELDYLVKLFANDPDKHFKTSIRQLKNFNTRQNPEAANFSKICTDDEGKSNKIVGLISPVGKGTITFQDFPTTKEDRISEPNYGEKCTIATAEKKNSNQENRGDFVNLALNENFLTKTESFHENAEQVGVNAVKLSKLDDIHKLEYSTTNESHLDKFQPHLNPEFSLLKTEIIECDSSENYPNNLEMNSTNFDQQNHFNSSSIEVLKHSLKVNRCQKLKIPVAIFHRLSSINCQVHPIQKIIVNPVDIFQFDSQCSSINKQIKCVNEDLTRKHQREQQNGKSSKINEVGDCHLKNLIFCRKQNLLSGKIGDTMICLCDPCFYKIQESVDDRLVNSKDEINTGIWQKKGIKNRICPEEMFFFPENECSFPFEDREDMENFSNHKVGFKSYMTKKLKMEGIEHCCEIVNNHLLNRTCCENQLDQAMSKKNAINVLRIKWLKQVGNKNGNAQKIRFYLDYFKAFSENLLKVIVYATDLKGNNVMHFAFSYSRFDIAKIFLTFEYVDELLKMKNEAGHSPFMICSISEPKTEMDWLVIYETLKLVDINETSDFSDQTPLMNAACCGSDIMIQILLDAGADPNIQDADGSTALMYAAQHGQEKCTSLLLEHPKCNPYIEDQDGETAFSIALSAGYRSAALLIYLKAKKRRKSCNVSQTVH